MKVTRQSTGDTMQTKARDDIMASWKVKGRLLYYLCNLLMQVDCLHVQLEF